MTPDISSDEKFQPFQAKVVALHLANAALSRCNTATYLTGAMFHWGFYIFPLAFPVDFYYPVALLVSVIMLRLRVALHQLSPDGWRVLASLPLLNHGR